MTANGDRRKTIDGFWRNQLGTRLSITANEDGSITGFINSDVGGVRGSHALIGYIAPATGSRGVIGFVVQWQEALSVTSWSGHYDLEHELIATNWLLTAADFDENEWQSTRVGHDVFDRDREQSTEPVAERSLDATGMRSPS